MVFPPHSLFVHVIGTINISVIITFEENIIIIITITIKDYIDGEMPSLMARLCRLWGCCCVIVAGDSSPPQTPPTIVTHFREILNLIKRNKH